MFLSLESLSKRLSFSKLRKSFAAKVIGSAQAVDSNLIIDSNLAIDSNLTIDSNLAVGSTQTTGAAPGGSRSALVRPPPAREHACIVLMGRPSLPPPGGDAPTCGAVLVAPSGERREGEHQKNRRSQLKPTGNLAEAAPQV